MEAERRAAKSERSGKEERREEMSRARIGEGEEEERRRRRKTREGIGVKWEMRVPISLV